MSLEYEILKMEYRYEKAYIHMRSTCGTFYEVFRFGLDEHCTWLELIGLIEKFGSIVGILRDKDGCGMALMWS